MWANINELEKAKADNFLERFREIISDPVNLAIKRVPQAGFVDDSLSVVLHNGNRVPLRGPGSYYGDFSDILIINRGVHEPLEEFCFQEMLGSGFNGPPVMLELGSYWAHYSMWMKKVYPSAICHMVEPEITNLEAGRSNFNKNGYEGVFHLGKIHVNGLSVDNFMIKECLEKIDVLHADIQGFEVEMLEGARQSLCHHRIDRIFISTHSDHLHDEVERLLKSHDYKIEVSSPVEKHTTSFDGFIMASAPSIKPIFKDWHPLGRLDILHTTTEIYPVQRHKV